MSQNPKSKTRKNSSIGDYLRAGKKAALSAVETAAAEAKAATERARKAAAAEAEARRLDSPEKALRVLASAHGYELVKKNPQRIKANVGPSAAGCSCGGKCAPCASRKNRVKARKNRVKARKNPKKVWWVDFIDGAKNKMTTSFSTKRQAQKWAEAQKDLLVTKIYQDTEDAWD